MASVRGRTLFSDQNRTVCALEFLDFQADRSTHRGFLFGSVKPVAIIVREADRTYALDLDGQLVDIDRLELPADLL